MLVDVLGTIARIPLTGAMEQDSVDLGLAEDNAWAIDYLHLEAQTTNSVTSICLLICLLTLFRACYY